MHRLSVFFSTAALCAAFAAPALAGPSAATVPLNAPRIRLGHSKSTGTLAYGWSSSNWSGYAITGTAPYTSITGNWIVPQVTGRHGSTYSSAWIGIDGFNNSNLIQTGTEQDYYSGSAHYDAWWEILPAAETVIPGFTVEPGNHMSASIVKGSNGQWTITLDDVTTGQTFSTVQSYSGPGSSAEWILEAPTIGGRVAPLANYGQTVFNPGTANGGNPGLVISDGGVMIQKRTQVSTPSSPDSDTDGFAIAYGSVAPAPPQS